MRIGIFDSGLGGINVLSCLIKKYPNNQYIFFGDTINLPYGDKIKDELFNLACKAIDFLLSKKVEMIIIACGTISSTCFKDLKTKYQIPLFDILSPTIKYLSKIKEDKIGVIATKRTIESNIFNIKNKHILMHATPSFVPLIENNLIEEKEEEIVKELEIFKDNYLLVLGCTHYPLLKNIIHSRLHLKTIDLGECLADTIKLSNDSTYSCELYFSLISTNLINNIDNILVTKYKIFPK